MLWVVLLGQAPKLAQNVTDFSDFHISVGISQKKHQDELKGAYTLQYLIFPCSRPRPKTRKAAFPWAFIWKHGQGRDESLGMEEIIVKAPKWSAEFSTAVGELLTGDSHILCSEGAGDHTLWSPAQQATKTTLSFRVFITLAGVENVI